MKKADKFFLWLFFAPSLLFVKDVKPWYLRILLVMLAPSTWIVLLPIFSLIMLSVSDVPNGPLDINHNLKSAEEISAITDSYIPECDTLGAVIYDGFPDFEIEEKFAAKKKLNKTDKKKLTDLCRNSSVWKETDSTYVYSNRRDTVIVNKSIFNYFKVIIKKKDGRMVVRYGTT